MERRLAAILAADVAGYTRLMGADEAGTLERLTALRREALEPLIAAQRGRVVKVMGDGLLVEFASVVDALTCAVAWQTRVAADQAALAPDRQFTFRIGINLGDVLVEGEDIHGDGVNLAARLEGLAAPGGICLSEDAYRQVRGKADVAFEDLGEQDLKNVAEPVRAYRVVLGGAAEAAPAMAAAIGLDLALPDEPSIAVLPFQNMGADPEQEFFSDGITEDIITALSKIDDLLVVARNSTFTYKGKAVDVKQVSREQGVRYVLEGSVRRAGKRVRVTAQLIDAVSGHHLWAERYDRDLEDIFATQDEITREVAVALDIRLRAGDVARFWSSGTKDLEAWECVRRAMDLLNHGVQDAPEKARHLSETAIARDPAYAMAWVTKGWCHHHGVDVGLAHLSSAARNAELEAGLACGNKALDMDPNSSDAYSLLSMCRLSQGAFGRGGRDGRSRGWPGAQQCRDPGPRGHGPEQVGPARARAQADQEGYAALPDLPGLVPLGPGYGAAPDRA